MLLCRAVPVLVFVHCAHFIALSMPFHYNMFVGRSSEDATGRERERVDVSSTATLTTITSPDEPKPSVAGDRRSAPQREREPREKDNKEDGVFCALCSLLSAASLCAFRS